MSVVGNPLLIGGDSLSKCTIIAHAEHGSAVGIYSNSAATTLVKMCKEAGTSGDFYATGLSTGTYYVKATKSGKSRTSAAITFAAYGIKNVVLVYNLFLYNRGTEGVPITVEYAAKLAERIYISTYATYGVYAAGAAYTTNVVDLSSFSSVRVNAAASGSSPFYGEIRIKSTQSETPVKTAYITKDGSAHDNVLDISDVSGSYIVEVWFGGTGTGGEQSGDCYVYEIELT